jgi:hypothetical protein
MIQDTNTNGARPMSNDTIPPARKPRPTAAAPAEQQMKLNTTNLKSTYCNMCNANTTREEVVLNFGVNQSWDRGQGDTEVALEHRIILSPFAAKRLAEMLTRLVAEYETRYGKLE